MKSIFFLVFAFIGLGSTTFADTITINTSNGPMKVSVVTDTTYNKIALTEAISIPTREGTINVPKQSWVDDYGDYYRIDSPQYTSNDSMHAKLLILGQPFDYDIFNLFLGKDGFIRGFEIWEHNQTPVPTIKMKINGQTRKVLPTNLFPNGHIQSAVLTCDLGCDNHGYPSVVMEKKKITASGISFYADGKVKGFELGDKNIDLKTTDGTSHTFQAYYDINFDENGIAFPPSNL